MISVVVIVHENNEINYRLVPYLLNQPSYNYELILILNNTSQKTNASFSELEDRFISTNLKIIYNTRVKSFSKIVLESPEFCSQKYVVFFEAASITSSDFINKIIGVVNEKDNVDLYEFKTRLAGLIKWNPRARMNLKENEIYDLKIVKNIVAYSFPFVFNKIFKISIIKKINQANFSCIESNVFSFFDFLYIYLLHSKTYKLIQSRIIKMLIDKSNYPSFSKTVKSWNKILEYAIATNSAFLTEIKYAKYYYFKIILLGLYSQKNLRNLFKNNSLMIERTKKYLYILDTEEFEYFDITNNYMFLKNEETQILSSNVSDTKILNLLEE